MDSSVEFTVVSKGGIEQCLECEFAGGIQSKKITSVHIYAERYGNDRLYSAKFFCGKRLLLGVNNDADVNFEVATDITDLIGILEECPEECDEGDWEHLLS